MFAMVWAALGLVLVVRAGGRERGVITDHLEFGRRLVAGEDLYAPFLDPGPLHPVYPPSFGLLTWPFSLLPERGARYAWALVQVAALWWIGRRLCGWLARLAPELRERAHWLLLATAVISLRYVLRDTHGGGGNLINLALALAALHWAARGRGVAAGTALGISLATKPVTALFVPLLWVLGWRRAALFGLGVAAALAALALAVHGRGAEPWARWAEGSLAMGAMTDPFAEPALGFPPFTWMNQCLRCALGRYLGTVPPELAAEVPGFFGGLGWPWPVVAGMTRAAALALVAWAAAVAWRNRSAAAAAPYLIAATALLSLLLSPISWKAHHVAVAPALFLLVAEAWRGNRHARIGAIAYFALCGAGGGDLVGPEWKNVQQSLYVATAGDLCLLVWCLRRAGRAPAPEGRSVN